MIANCWKMTMYEKGHCFVCSLCKMCLETLKRQGRNVLMCRMVCVNHFVPTNDRMFNNV